MTSLEARCKAMEMESWGMAWRALSKLAGKDWNNEALEAALFFEKTSQEYYALEGVLRE